MAEITRRTLLKAGGAAVAVAGAGVISFPKPAAAQSPPPGSWNHNPASPIGPSHWGDIGFPACRSGASQSPVNIVTDSLAVHHGPPIALQYEPFELSVENTGHVVEVMTPKDVTCTALIGDQSYKLVQYHFHTPSEHAVNGRHAAVEGHFVHQNAQGALAVIGVFYRIGVEPNPVLDKILLSAPVTAGDEVKAGEATPVELFNLLSTEEAWWPSQGVQVDRFCTYNGSLTTPGCTEGVLWSVLPKAGGVSEAAVARFHRVVGQFPYYDGYRNNNRPVQPLNTRVVQFRDGSPGIS